MFTFSHSFNTGHKGRIPQLHPTELSIGIQGIDISIEIKKIRKNNNINRNNKRERERERESTHQSEAM